MKVKVFDKGIDELPNDIDILTMPELRCLIAGLGGEAIISVTYRHPLTGETQELAIIKEKGRGDLS